MRIFQRITAVYVLLALVLCYLWYSLDLQRSKHLEALLHSEVQSHLGQIESDIRSRISALGRLSDRWIFQEGTSKAHFQSDATNYVNDMPGFQAIEWVDDQGYVRWVVPLEGNEQAVDFHLAKEDKRRAALEEAKSTRGPTMTSPVGLVQGGKGYLVYIPIFIGDKFDGFILSVIHIERWLDHVLNFNEAQSPPGLIVYMDDIPVFKTIAADEESLFEVVESTSFLGRKITVTVKSTPNFLAENHSYFPELVTFFALILASVLIFAVHLVINLTKVTEEKDLLSKAIEFTTTGIVITDSEKNIIWANKAFTDISGYSLNEVKGATLFSFLKGKETDQTTIDTIKKALNNEDNVNVEILNDHKDGRSYWHNLFITPVYSGDELSNFISLQNDITEYKVQREQFARLQRVETINDLAAGIAHDINNILGIIEGNKELLELKVGDQSVSKYFDAITKATERAKNTTTKLLRSSKQKQSVSENIDLVAVINELHILLSEVIPNNVELRINSVEPSNVKLSQVDLEDALTNIIVNSANAIEHHGLIDISSRIERTFRPNHQSFVFSTPCDSEQYAVVRVHDNGCGVPPEHFEDIFTPFFSMDKTSSGSGLGLSMVAGFVAREKLGLTVNSIPNEGTTFEIWIPCLDTPQSTMATTNQEFVNREHFLKILLIDDESALLDVTKSLLEALNHGVIAFSNPHDAELFLQSNLNDIDLIITDEVMPGPIQGHDIFNKYSHLKPTIIISGFIKKLPQNIPKANLLSKPFTLKSLAEAISQQTKTGTAPTKD